MSKSAAATKRPVPILCERSPTKPAPYGPRVWATAKITVNRLMAWPQLSGGKFWRVKLVTALGAMKTERPKTTAEISNDRLPGQSTGRAEPSAMQLRIIARGTPDAWCARMGRQTNGEMQIHRPKSTQTADINSALADCSVIHADKNVR